MRQFLFLQASARSGGNAASLARLAAEALGDAGQDWRDLTDPALPPFTDLRHGASYGAPGPVAADLAHATLAASDLVFVAPLYWYGLPAPAKLYLDHWSHWMRVPGLDFTKRMAGKNLWLVMSHAGSSEAELAPAIEGLRLSGAYLGLVWQGALLVDANTPGDWRKDQAAMARAQGFFAT